jgi:hypothetical protein
VFHEEKKAFDEAKDTINDWIFADSWRYATYDVVTKQFDELEDLGWNSGGYYSVRIDGKFYLLTPNGYGSGFTTYYQLNPDGSTKKALSMDGWSTRAFKIR